MAQRPTRSTSGQAFGSTRERILFEASNLFARYGYHATTTRQIAGAVGIQQPSLFHHFASKAAIVEALLGWDLDQALPYVEGLAAEGGSAAVRLYHYLCHDLAHLAGCPYNLSGIYAEDVMGDPAFARWAGKRERVHAAVERILREGIDTGEFIDVQPALVRESIAGILVRALTLYSGGRHPAGPLGDQIALLLLRGLLTDPSRFPEVRRRALERQETAAAAPAR
jgi:AcrR family transcriptional regulator